MACDRVCLARLYSVLLCSLVGVVLSTGLGKCPVLISEPLDIEKMTGVWYEVERSFYLMEITESCTELNATLNDKGYLSVTVNTVNRWTRSPSTQYGLGIPSAPNSPTIRYKVQSRAPYLLGRLLPGAGLYHVLYTDYQRFAIVWSCTSFRVAHSDHIWLLGRSREFDAPLRQLIYDIMLWKRLDPDRLVLSSSFYCPADTVDPANATDHAQI